MSLMQKNKFELSTRAHLLIKNQYIGVGGTVKKLNTAPKNELLKKVEPQFLTKNAEEKMELEHGFDHDTNELPKYTLSANKEHFVQASNLAKEAYKDKANSAEAIKAEQVNFELILQLPDIEEISLGSCATTTLNESEDEKVRESVEDFNIDPLLADIEFSDIDYDFDACGEEEFLITTTREVKNENLFDEFFQRVGLQTIDDFQVPDPIDFVGSQAAQQLLKDTKAFLCSLIATVAEAPQSLLQVQMFKKLTERLKEIQIESKVNDFLSQRCVLHYRRLKSYRPITPEPQGDSMLAKRKYAKIIEDLNGLTERERAEGEFIEKRLQQAEGIRSEAETRLKDMIAHFESSMRQTFIGRKSLNLKSTIETSLRNISILREEISKLRKVLIEQQHNEVKLQAEKIGQLQNLTDGVSLKDYELMQEQIIWVKNKIEDKTVRLEKLKKSFHAITNTVAHLRGKQALLCHAMKEQLKQLAEAQSEQKKLFHQNHKLKLSRLKLLKDLQDKSWQCGLLDKPALLWDYESTADLSSEMRANLKEKEALILKLRKQISILKGQFETKDLQM